MALKDFVSKGIRPDETSRARPAAPIVEAASPAPTAASAQRSSPPVAFLDASVGFTGTIRCRESIRIDGRCEGELYCEASVIIGEQGVLRMSIEADSVAIAGEVNGNITARRKITLEPTARVNGNLCTPGIVIQEGAKLEGRIVIGSEDAPAKSAGTQSAAKERTAPAESVPAPPRKPPTPSAPPPTS